MPQQSTDLDDKQRRFCEEYIIDLNATQAAIRAGYTEKLASAAVIGARLLRNVKVAGYINRLNAALSAKSGANAERVIREIGAIAFDASEKALPRLKALELLGKHMNLFEPRPAEAVGETLPFTDMLINAYKDSSKDSSP